MCGIAGIVGNNHPTRLEAMVAAMHHRGPNDHGVFRSENVAMGMARLSILDLSPAGHQPMSNDDGSIWIVYNGETYNYQERRNQLEAEGIEFRSHSDTEVVLRLYERFGDEFLTRLRGMFALAIWDRRNGRDRLLLARDHLGIKPLLYAQTTGGLVFASEIKAMLASGLIEPAVDPEGLRLLLTFGSVTQPYSLIKGVKMLLPGHRLILEKNKPLVIEPYWRIGINRVSEVKNLGHGELVQTVGNAIDESVRLQMVSDVPLGAFLSGGTDSSLLVSLMSRHSNHKVKTFSVGYPSEGASIDETEDAARIANFIGTDHTRVEIDGVFVRDRIKHMAASLDQPSVDGANSYLVSLAARQAVTVSISGTGGDELFAGYPWFIQMASSSAFAHDHPLRTSANQRLGSLVSQPAFDPLVTRKGGWRIEAMRAKTSFLAELAAKHQIFGAAGAANILSAPMRANVHAGKAAWLDLIEADELPNAAPIERVSAFCLRGYALNQLLRDIDAVSMAHSLEVRVPFLDPVLTDLALSIPPSAKLGTGSNAAGTYAQSGAKKILLDIAAARNLLPPNMGSQPKRGFGMPFESWMRGQLRETVEDTLSKRSVIDRGWLDPNAVSSLRDRFFAGKAGWTQPWLLMMTELWAREVLDRSGGITS